MSTLPTTSAFDPLKDPLYPAWRDFLALIRYRRNPEDPDIFADPTLDELRAFCENRTQCNSENGDSDSEPRRG